MMIKAVALTAVPFGVLTVIGPLVALVGTVAETDWLKETLNAAGTPLNRTDVAVSRLAPLMVMLSPGRP